MVSTKKTKWVWVTASVIKRSTSLGDAPSWTARAACMTTVPNPAENDLLSTTRTLAAVAGMRLWVCCTIR